MAFNTTLQIICSASRLAGTKRSTLSFAFIDDGSGYAYLPSQDKLGLDGEHYGEVNTGHAQFRISRSL